jgi:hypothetical protein
MVLLGGVAAALDASTRVWLGGLAMRALLGRTGNGMRRRRLPRLGFLEVAQVWAIDPDDALAVWAVPPAAA